MALSERSMYGKIRQFLQEGDYFLLPHGTPFSKRPRLIPDVVAVKNVGGKFHDEIEVVAVEAKAMRRITQKEVQQAAAYKPYAHRVYLATTLDLRDKAPDALFQMQQQGIGWMFVRKGVRIEVPERSDWHEKRTADDRRQYLNALGDHLGIIQCALCGCFHQGGESAYHDADLWRVQWFNALADGYDSSRLRGELRESLKDPQSYRSTLPDARWIARHVCPGCEGLLAELARVAFAREAQ